MTDATEADRAALLANELRMAFNEALAGGPNMNGDGGPIIQTEGHAQDLQLATDCINELRERGQNLAEALKNMRADLRMRSLCKTGEDHGLPDVDPAVWDASTEALAAWDSGK